MRKLVVEIPDEWIPILEATAQDLPIESLIEELTCQGLRLLVKEALNCGDPAKAALELETVGGGDLIRSLLEFNPMKRGCF